MFEAGNFIPHNLDAVKIDYHIIGESGRNQLDVLVVAVKNEILESFVDCLSKAGLETAIVDVDYFALQNMVELNYPELSEKTLVLMNIGARYTAVNICRNGECLFTGDIMLGGRHFTEAVAEATSLPFDEAEKLKRKPDPASPNAAAVLDALNRKVDAAASDYNRQLSFFWSATGSDAELDGILVTGGAAQTHNLAEALAEKTGLEVQKAECLRGVEVGTDVDPAQVQALTSTIGVCVGLGLRQPGDKFM
jgi:type IV pilus assembly protein PilM